MRPSRSQLLAVALAAAALAGPASPVQALSICLSPPVAAPIVIPFRQPGCRWCPGNRGVDYATAAGTPVLAAGAGTVTFAGPVAGSVWVTVAHDGGLLTSYGPLRKVTVRRGAMVAAGRALGTTAGSLHFGVRTGGQYIDPEPLLGQPVHLVPRLVPLTGRIAPPPGRCPAGVPGPPVR